MTARRKPQPRTLRKETIRRRAAQADAERAQLVSAATELFSSHGYHETSIRDIAREAGFSIGALYQRYSSKDALYCDVVEQHYGRIWDAIDRAVTEHAGFRARLLALTEAIFTHIATNRTFLRLYELHAPTIAEPYRSKIAKFRRLERSRRALVDAFAQGYRDGDVGDADAELLGTIYYGMLNRLVIDFLMNDRALPDGERLVTLFIEGAARPPQKRAARARRR